MIAIAFRPTCFLLLCDITIVPFRPKSKSESQNFEVSWENKFQLSWKVSWKSFKWVEFQNLKPLPGLVAASGGSDSLSAANWCDWPAEIGDVRRCQVMLCATASLVKNWLSFSDWLNQHVSQCYIAIKVFSESNVHDPVVMMMTINCVARSHYTLLYLFCRCQKGRISPRFTNVFFSWPLALVSGYTCTLVSSRCRMRRPRSPAVAEIADRTAAMKYGIATVETA